MTLTLQTRIIGSAHRLTERNISAKFIVNRLKGSGDIERTQTRNVNSITLKCDLDLE